MSLLTICQNAARYAGLVAPLTVVDNADQSAVQLLAVAKNEIRSLARRHNWAVLQREHTFSTVNGDADYALPSDFSRLISDTAWNRTADEPMRGPTTPQSWQAFRSSGVQPALRDHWRIFATAGTNQFHVEPTPTSVEALAFEYVSDEIVQSSAGAGRGDWLADFDVSRLDEYVVELGVIWRLLSRKGYEFADDRLRYELEVERLIARDGGSGVLNLRGRRARVPPELAVNTPQDGFG